MKPTTMNVSLPAGLARLVRAEVESPLCQGSCRLSVFARVCA